MKVLVTLFMLCSLFALLLGITACDAPSSVTTDLPGTSSPVTTPLQSTAPATATTTPANSTTITTTAKTDPVVTPVSEVINVNTALKRAVFTSEEGQRLPYRLFLPADYNESYAYPVVLFLHGAGERGSDNSSHLKNVVQKLFDDPSSPFYQCILICPQCPSEAQWVDTPWSNGNYFVNRTPLSKPLGAALELLDSLMETYSINPARQYVMGISMGGFGTWDLLMRYPDRFAAAIPICGGADTSYADELVNIPIQTFHDSTDTIVPYSGTSLMVKAIERAGGELITFTTTNQYGHGVWDAAVETEGLFDWLFSQRKDSLTS